MLSCTITGELSSVKGIFSRISAEFEVTLGEFEVIRDMLLKSTGGEVIFKDGGGEVITANDPVIRDRCTCGAWISLCCCFCMRWLSPNPSTISGDWGLEFSSESVRES